MGRGHIDNERQDSTRRAPSLILLPKAVPGPNFFSPEVNASVLAGGLQESDGTHRTPRSRNLEWGILLEGYWKQSSPRELGNNALWRTPRCLSNFFTLGCNSSPKTGRFWAGLTQAHDLSFPIPGREGKCLFTTVCWFLRAYQCRNGTVRRTILANAGE